MLFSAWIKGHDTAAPLAGDGQAASQGPSQRSSRPDGRAADEVPHKHSYPALKAILSEPGGRPEMRQAVERMNSAELRALLATAKFPIFGPSKTAEDQWLDQAVSLAAEELFRREGAVAVEWADKTGRKETSYALMEAFMAGDPAGAQEHFKTYPFGYWDRRANWLISGAARAAVMRSADDLLAVEKLWSSDVLGSWVPEVADGFDYKKYLSQTTATASQGPWMMIGRWATVDGEGSGEYLREKLRNGDPDGAEMIAYALDGRSRMSSEDAAAKWACSLMPPYPDGPRDTILGRIAIEMSGGRAEAMIRNLPTDADRTTFTVALLQRYNFGGQAEYWFDALQAMQSDTLRADTLSRYISDKSGYGLNAEGRQAAAEKIMNRISLPESERARVRAAMQASPPPPGGR